MHVGLITACYEPVINGVTRMVSLYRSGLEELGHRVTIFTLGRTSTFDEAQGIYISPGIPLGNTGYFLSPRYTSQAQSELRKLDIIHCHHLIMGLEFAHRYGRCPIVFTNHTRYDLYIKAYAKIPDSATNIIMDFVWPKLTRYCDTVVVPAEATRNIIRNFGVEEPIRVIPNGIELPQFYSPKKVLKKSDLGLSEDSILMIYVGRISAEKNISFLLTEFSFATRINRRLHLALVGSGPMTNQIRQSVQRLGLGDKVHLIGEVNNDQLPAYLAAADFFVTASTSEVHPLTLIEAMASSLPIVAVSSPGTTEIVSDDLTGLLAEERTHDLADKMIILAANSALRAKFSHNSFVASNNYDIRLTISRSLSLYEGLLANSPLGNDD